MNRRPTHSKVDYSKVLGLPSTVALGCTIAVGLVVFIVMGPLLEGALTQTPAVYLLSILVLVPIVLTLAERAAVTGGSGGFYNLMRAHRRVWLGFGVGWMLLGGYTALIAVLTVGASLYLDQLLQTVFDLEVEVSHLGAIFLAITAIAQFVGIQVNWRLRTTLIFTVVVLGTALGIWNLIAPAHLLEQPGQIITPDADLFSIVPWLAAGLWGASFILDNRNQIRSPTKTLPLAMAIPLGIGGLLGALIAYTLLHPINYNLIQTPVPLIILSFLLNPLFGLLFLVGVLAILIIALNQAMLGAMRLIGAMTVDGYFPEKFQYLPGSSRRVPVLTLLWVTLISLASLYFVSTLMLFATAVLTFLLGVIAVNLPNVFQVKLPLPDSRAFKLPMHPLFPGLAVVLSFSLILSLPPMSWAIGGGWLMLGLLWYVTRGREATIALRQKAAMVGELADEQSFDYQVLVCVSSLERSVGLVRAGARLAGAQGGQLLVMRVLDLPQQMTSFRRHKIAQTTWQQLAQWLETLELGQTPVKPLVRIAPSVLDGIQETTWEEKANLILLGWPETADQSSAQLREVVEPVVRSVTTQVAVLDGALPETGGRIMVPTGNAHAGTALQLAQILAGSDGQVMAVQLVHGALNPEREAYAKTQLEAALSQLEDASGVESRIESVSNEKKGILDLAQEADLLIMGVASGGFLADNLFGGLPVEIAQARAAPTLLIKKRERTHRFWLRQSWTKLSGVLPKLTRDEQTAISTAMRHDAKATIDYYVLMFLAATIAFFGLLLNSAAVIIGAMLVAPLMSPMIAMAHGLVRGNLHMFRQATNSTVSGVVFTIFVGMFFTLIMPFREATPEILARTSPNLLDLMVALASGAAAAYALSRKEVSAALPGVAVAAALVPPLCVVGFGLGSARFDIVGGALLLFVTNLAAITMAGIVVFLLLGFRPEREERTGQVQRGLVFSIVTVAVLMIPLGMTTWEALQQNTQKQTAEIFLEENLSPTTHQTLAIEISDAFPQMFDIKVSEGDDGRLIIDVFTYASQQQSETFDIDALTQDLSQSLGRPVTLRTVIVPAKLQVSESDAGQPEGVPPEEG